MLKTDKMEKNNGDTYEVPLKGGIMSYNITSIKGVDVMHYFKNYFDKKATKTKINGEENIVFHAYDKDAEYGGFPVFSCMSIYASYALLIILLIYLMIIYKNLNPFKVV